MRAWIISLLLIPTLVWADDEETTTSRLYNVRVSPIVVFGLVDIEADFKFHPKLPSWTLGPVFKFWNFSETTDGISDIKVTFWAVGARANWYYNGAFQEGPFVSPTLMFGNAAAKTNYLGSNASASTTSLIFQAVGGYAWFWDRANLHIGGGFAAPLGSNRVKLNAAGSQANVDYGRSTQMGIVFDISAGFMF